VLTWLVGVTAGVAVRALVLGRAVNGHEAAFLVTSLVFTLLLVLGCRALAVRRLRRRAIA
jgi:tellurite resistance protein TehA-like permease